MKTPNRIEPSLAIFLSVFLVVACGETDKPTEPAAPVGEKPAPEEPPPPPAEAVKETDTQPEEPALEPLKTPEAYFGKPDLTWLDKPVETAAKENHSVVLVIADALNASHMSSYGYHRETTPNLDRLIKDGVLFTNYVSNSSWTRPSFTTLITGQPKSVHKMEWDGNNLDEDIVTVAERFRKAGYRTGAVVGNQVIQARWRFDQGFQKYEDVSTLDQIYPRDERLMNTAISWLKRTGDDPFYLMIFLIDTHAPYRPLRAYREFLKEVPEGEVIRFPRREYREPLPKDDHDRMVAAYDGEVMSVDAEINRLVEYLKANDKLENTSIIVTADHGEAFGHHNCYTHTYHQWESVLRVPFMILSPLIPAQGVYDDRAFTHLDVAPTLLDLAGIEYEKDDLPGISIVEALKDPTAVRDRTIFSQFNAHGVRRQTIRRDPWKLVHHHKVEDEALSDLLELKLYKVKQDKRNLPSLAWDGERYDFYNLEEDPQETTNLNATHQDKPEYRNLYDALQPYLAKKVEAGVMTPEMRKALENIGYIEPQEQ